MALPVLTTKLYIPLSRSKVVLRPHLIDRLGEGLCQNHDLSRKLTLISAPAGFGKTTLVTEWLRQCDLPAAWLSLDEGDNDLTRFMTYLVAALRMIYEHLGDTVLGMLQSPQQPPAELILTALLNEISILPGKFILVLDDYHVIDAKPVDDALTFLLDHLPPQMHIVVTTREDPALPLARLRARGQLTELRAADLRFTPSEAAEFLKQVMDLNLSAEEIAILEARTEGWIAGLQLAAISIQGHPDTASFIRSFSGSHHFVMDYLLEEVLRQQPETVQKFLLHTSILDRLCAPLCDAILRNPSVSGQGTLEYLEHANLFIIPLDNERRWYRYHHLFSDLLRQRLYQTIALSTEDRDNRLKELHIRASQWYEDNRFQLEAFRHAAAANDIERAERLIDGKGIPFHFRGGVTPILNWLESLSTPVLNARPSLWWRYAALLLIAGRTDGVEEKLQGAEAAVAAILQGAEPDDKTRNLIGQIAAARATLALTRYDMETMLTQSRRALAYLDASSLSSRGNANWTLGYSYILQGDRTEARRALLEAILLSKQSGAIFTLILASIGLGNVQEADNQLFQAAETYQSILQLAGEQPQQIIHEAHLGMARILYQWNDLDAAEQHARRSIQLARQYDVQVIDRFILCEVFLARVKRAQGDLTSAQAILSQVDQSAHQPRFTHRIPEVVAERVCLLIRQGNLAMAENLANTLHLPLSQARVYLAQGDSTAALALLESFLQQVTAKGWQDERLKGLILQAMALQAHGEKDKAVQVLDNALALAEPGGFVRMFLDEGLPMRQLLTQAAVQAVMPDYVRKLLAAFEVEQQKSEGKVGLPHPPSPFEPLSKRELEILQLIAQGLSNQEISERLFLALITVKVHNQKIFGKLQVKRRTEAVARARALGIF
jgi:LuxR family maltose regulon positive regulatory protein